MVVRFDFSRFTTLRVTLIAPVAVSIAAVAEIEACGESPAWLCCGESVAAEAAPSILNGCGFGFCGEGNCAGSLAGTPRPRPNEFPPGDSVLVGPDDSTLWGCTP